MPQPQPGEVWVVDLGLAAKMRPCLLLGDYPSADELNRARIMLHQSDEALHVFYYY
jgi:hypothetical protein